MRYSIIGNGLIGHALHNQALDSVLFTRENSFKATQDDHDVLVIVAPTGNRLVVNNNTEKDLADCDRIIELVSQCNYNHLVYISTVDVYPTHTSNNADPSSEQPSTAYGSNRWYLEHVLSTMSDSHIIRLPTLSDLSLNKNILYDLKTKSWLDKICLESYIQWYPLKRLNNDIEFTINNTLKYQNLCSSPVCNRTVVQQFFPELIEQLNANQLTPVKYDIKNNDQSYPIPLEEIWQSFEEFFH